MNKDTWKSLKYYSSISGEITTFPEIELTQRGEFRMIGNKKDIKVYCGNNENIYPTIMVKFSDNKLRKFLVHIAVASTFLDNVPSTKGFQVNHKDHNRKNYSLDNLEFVTPSVNQIFRKTKGKEVTDIKYVKGSTTVQISKDLFDKLNSFIDRRGDMELILNYLNEQNWITLREGCQISDSGIIKRIYKTKERYSLGNLDSKGYYVSSFPENYPILVHRVVAIVFLNNNKILGPKEEEVDHIDTDITNNNVSNLRIVDRSANMQNAQKFFKPISLTTKKGSIYYFKNEKIAAKQLGVSYQSICDWIVDRYTNSIGLKEIRFATKEEILKLQNGELKYSLDVDRSELEPGFNRPSKLFKTVDDINEFLRINKIASRKDLVKKNLLYIYKYAEFRGWIKNLIYYKE